MSGSYESIGPGHKVIGRINRDLVRQYLFQITRDLGKVPLDTLAGVTFCGSYRRQLPQIGDLDVAISLISDTDSELTSTQFAVKASLIWESLTAQWGDPIRGGHWKRGEIGKEKADKKAQFIYEDRFIIDVYLTPESLMGAMMLYLTGDVDFNKWTRLRAKKLGLQLSQKGLIDLETGDIIAGANELYLLSRLGLPYIEPKNRNLAHIKEGVEKGKWGWMPKKG
jgi:DNA polymerase/3'-5' exonuclease PolX